MATFGVIAALWCRTAAIPVVIVVLLVLVGACGGPPATSVVQPTATPLAQASEPSATVAAEPTTEGARMRDVMPGNPTPLPIAKEINGCKIEEDTQCPGADLSGADLGAITSKGHPARLAANLSGGNFSGANLEGAYMARIDLSGADLSNTNLRGANLYQAMLFEADLTGADLTDVDLSFADMEDAVTDGAIFCRTTMPDTSTNNSGCP
ncbi:MAG: pentapeptide repeat-containing protein [SAR202 cluster bacterium]|nr:pentapeptide repeat-containing protein [SAR202 cluster bacterium]